MALALVPIGAGNIWAEGGNAQSLRDLAFEQLEAGRLFEALDLALNSAEIGDLELEPDDPFHAGTDVLIATILSRLGYHGWARDFARFAYQAMESAYGEDDPALAPYMARLGIVSRDAGDLASAKTWFTRSLALNETAQGPNDLLLVPDLLNLVDLHLTLGGDDLMATADLLARARAITAAAAPNSVEMARVMEYEAYAILSVARYADPADRETIENAYVAAEVALRQAIDIREREQGRDHLDLTLPLSHLAWLHRRTGRITEAWGTLSRLMDLAEDQDRPDLAIVLEGILLAGREGAYDVVADVCRSLISSEDESLRNVFVGSTESQMLSYIRQRTAGYMACLSLLREAGEEDSAIARQMFDLVLRRKAIVGETERLKRGHRSSRTSQKFEPRDDSQHLRLRRELATRLTLRSGADLTGDTLATLSRELQELEAHTASEAEDTAHLRIVSANDVVAALPAGAVLIEYIKLRDLDRERDIWKPEQRYLAFVVTTDHNVKTVDLGHASPIDAAIATARKAIRLSGPLNSAPQMEALTRLHDLIWQSVADLIGSAEAVFIAPDGALNLVPFGALVQPGGRFLIEDKTISLLTSGRDLIAIEGAPEVTPTPPVVVSDPDYDLLVSALDPSSQVEPLASGLALKRLPSFSEEAESIAKVFEGTPLVLSDKAATTDAVLAVKNPRVLHFATHGFFFEETTIEDERPALGMSPLLVDPAFTRHALMLSQAGLALTGANAAHRVRTGDDGILSAYEVIGMDLHATDLVVLSACDTGLGVSIEGEGIIGLGRAFRIAGARSLIMSLWPVFSLEALRQIRRFYALYVGGMRPPAALAKVQRERIAWYRTYTINRSAAPVLWAAFIAQGI